MPGSTVPVVVIGGYLGAGKTTMINRLLARSTEPVAVIVNDFGSVNVDAALVRESHADTIEFTNGCICCAAGSSLADTLFTILERPTVPTVIVIEASGAADPAVVAGFSHLGGLRPGGTVVLVDTINAGRTSRDRLVARTFARQIAAADVVVLSKTDDLDSDVPGTLAIVRTHNEHAAVVTATPDTLFDLVTDPGPSAPGALEPRHDPFSTETFGARDHDDTDSIRERLRRTPNVVRAKGVVELLDGSRMLVQSVGGTVRFDPIDLPPTGLVVIRSVDPGD